jgi:nitronate monooxygenase
MANSLLQQLKLKTPIILAPLARGPSTPGLAAAVSNAGRLGSLGLEYLSLDQLRQTIQRTRELTVGPINANLFAPMPRPSAHVDLPAAMTEVAKAHQELAIALPRAAQALTRQLRRNIRRRSRLASGSLQLHLRRDAP